MKTVFELKKELNNIPELTKELVDTKQKPNAVVVATYQRVFDLFHFLLTDNIERMKERLSKEEKPPKFFTAQLAASSVPLTTLAGPTASVQPPTQNVYAYCESYIQEAKNYLNDLSNHLVVGGGSLSEQFIKHYNQPFKDVDVFVNSDLVNYLVPVELEKERKHFNRFEELNLLMGTYGIHPIEKSIDEKGFLSEGASSVYMEKRDIEAVYHSSVDDVEVDFVFVQRMALDFDLAFREFYYNGGTIFASPAALQDIEENVISIVSMTTPFSTYCRLIEFSNRYSMKIDDFSKDLLLKNIHNLSKAENINVLEKFNSLKKAKTPSDIEWAVAEISKRVPSNFEQSFLDSITGHQDKFLFYRNRLRYALEQERSGIEFDLHPVIDLTDFELKDIGDFTSLTEDVVQKLFKVFKTKQTELQLKSLFSNDTNKMFAEFRDNMRKEAEELGFYLDPYKVTNNPHNFDILLNGILLKESSRINPSYSIENFKNEAFAIPKQNAELLFYSMKSNQAFVTVPFSHLIMELSGPNVSIKFNSKQEQECQLEIYQQLQGVDNNPKFVFSASGNPFYSYGKRNDELFDLLNAQLAPVRSDPFEFTVMPSTPFSSNISEEEVNHYTQKLLEAREAINQFRIEYELSLAEIALNAGIPENVSTSDDLPF